MPQNASIELTDLLKNISSCQLCNDQLPLGANPVVVASPAAKLLIIGQAPGIKVHQSGIPWNDASGKRLREWLGIEPEVFYDASKIAIMPMAFCYPGRGKSGDLPPPKICSKTWHLQLLQQLPNIQLTLYIGQYAQNYYLGPDKLNLTKRVRQFKNYPQSVIPLPHPSPRNAIWLKKNSWFETDLLPELKARIIKIGL